MKQFSATEARKNFFKLLDSAVEGETVTIKRKGIVLKLVPSRPQKTKKVSGYSPYIHSDVSKADQWVWHWDPNKGLISKKNR
ncbi:MAG: type II toxin-antitoxin system Phd/YefM family antitoxin [Deltaproteobacteria bacterium]|nr:type II toxin-antitoxin system Phd/YefM family antitoxin [Deltaproteobacteria bacterium]